KAVEAYVNLLDEGKLALSGKLGGVTKIIFETPERNYEAKVPQGTRPQEKSLDICEIDLSEKSVIGYDDYIRIIEELKKVPELSVYPTAVSYKGRHIYAVEIRPHLSGYISRTKRITAHPSQIID